MSAHRKSMQRCGVLFAVGLVTFWVHTANPEGATATAPSDAVVGLEIVASEVPADAPYATPTIVRRKASGLQVAPGLVLTNIESVRDSVSVKTRVGTVSVDSVVRHAAPDAGLALVSFAGSHGNHLAVSGPSATVSASSSVDIFGYDVPSRSVRLVRLRVAGTVVRLLHNSDVDSRQVILLDDPPGETLAEFNGGPTFFNGRFLGVYHQGRPSYILPVELASHVILDAADNKYEGFPDAGFLFQPVSGAAHRLALGLGAEENGVFVRRVLYGSGAWQKLRTGDLVMAVNGSPLSPTGDLVLSEGRVSISRYFSGLQVGPAALTVRRGTRTVNITINAQSYAGHRWKRQRPRDQRPYLVTAGLVFQELDYNLLHQSPAGKERLLRYRYSYSDEDGLAEQVDRDVMLSGVLADPATHGAARYRYGIVEYLNQRRIRSLKHLAEELRRAQDRFLVLRFTNHTAPLVLERELVPALDERIYARYRVRAGGTVEAAP